MKLLNNLLVVTLMSPSLAPACTDERQEKCDSLLEQANSIIELQDKIIGKQQVTIKDLTEITQDQDQQLRLLKEGQDAWYHKPTITIPISLLLGFAAGFLISK